MQSVNVNTADWRTGGKRMWSKKLKKVGKLAVVSALVVGAVVLLIGHFGNYLDGVNMNEKENALQLNSNEIAAKRDASGGIFINSGPTSPKVNSPTPPSGEYITSLKVSGGTTWTTGISGWFGNANPLSASANFAIGTPWPTYYAIYQCGSPKYINKLVLWMAEQPKCPATHGYCHNQLARMEVYCNDGALANVVASSRLSGFGVNLGEMRTMHTVPLGANNALSGLSVVTGNLAGYGALYRFEFSSVSVAPPATWSPSGGALSTFTHATLKGAILAKGCPRYIIFHGSFDRFLRVYGCDVTSSAITIDAFWGHEHAGRVSNIFSLDSNNVMSCKSGHFYYNKAPVGLAAGGKWCEHKTNVEVVFQTTVVANAKPLDPSPSQTIDLMIKQKTCPTSVIVKSTSGEEIVLGMDTTCLVFATASAPWPDLYFNRRFPNGHVGFLQIRGTSTSSVTHVWVSGWDNSGALTSAVGSFTTGESFDLNTWYPLGRAFHVVAAPGSFAVTF